MTGRVSLEGLEFHAYHGVYAHERTSGNKFAVDVHVDTAFGEAAFRDELSGTINYEDLYRIVKEAMEKPTKLLESVGHTIADEVLGRFVFAKEVEVTISKFNPPIGGVCHRAAVTVVKGRK